MPKSIYDKIQSGEQVLSVTGSAIETTSQRTVINGNTYEILSSGITASDVRESNSTRMGIRLDLCR